MKTLRIKWIIGIIFIVLFFGVLIVLSFGGLFSPEKKINDIEKVGVNFEDFVIPADVKVVGIGEATHGNREFQIAKKEVLQKLVEEGDCRAIAFELSVGQGAMVNEAIHESETDLTELVGTLDYALYDTEEMVGLLEWMRDYNESVPYEESLMFYGVDMQGADRSVEYMQSICNAGMDVFTEEEVEEILSINLDDPELYDKIDSERDFFEGLAERLSASDDIESKLLYVQARTLVQNIDAPSYESEPGEYSNHRDSSMALNLKSFSEVEEMRGYSQIVMTAHNGHVMKGSSTDYGDDRYLTMGEYINRYFEGSYFCIGTEYYNACVNIHTAGTYDENYERANHDYCSDDPLAYQARFFDGEKYCLDYTKLTEADGKLYKMVHGKVFTGVVGEGYSPLNDLEKMERLKLVPADRFDAMIYYYEVTPIDPIHY